MWKLALIFLTGFLVSGFGTIVGFMGVFMVPILVLVYRIPIHYAIGSVILALFPSALISTFSNWKRKLVDFPTGIMLEIPTAMGTVLGAAITSWLPTFQLELLFGVMVVTIGTYMLRKASGGRKTQSNLLQKLNRIPPGVVRHTPHGTYQMSGILIAGFGLTAGLIAGMFGIGGGFLKTPIMVLGFGIPPRIAVATALFMIVITSSVGSVAHYMLGHLHLSLGIPLLISFALGAVAGNSLGVKLPEKKLMRLVSCGLMAAGMSMLIYALASGGI